MVLFELAIIAYMQWRYIEVPPVAAAAKVMLGGGLVLATGILIGQARGGETGPGGRGEALHRDPVSGRR